MTPWDGSQGILDDDDVTALVEGRQEGTMWAGGDFGLTLIDLISSSVSFNGTGVQPKWTQPT